MKRSVLVLACALAACGEGAGGGGTSAGTNAFAMLAPSDGTVIVAGTIQNVAWQAADHDDATVDIWLYTPDGESVAVATGLENGGVFDWEVPLLRPAQPGPFRLEVVRPGTGDPSAPAPGLPRPAALAPDGGPDDDGGEQDGPGADDLAVGSFATLRWNDADAVEEYVWVDVHTGASSIAGTIGDLATLPWPQPVAADNANKLLYVVGMDGTAAGKVYTLDSRTGELLHDVELADALPDAIATDAAGQLLGFRWNGAEAVEEIVRIDPVAGSCAAVGTVGDLATWIGEVAVDTARDRLYVVGMPASGGPTLYTLVSTSAELLAATPLTLDGTPLDELLGLAVNAEGAVLGFRWNGSAEELLLADPETGAATVLGTVGDLQSWSTISALNLSCDLLYVIGNDGAEEKLYVLDARTSGEAPAERLVYDLPVLESPDFGLLVY